MKIRSVAIDPEKTYRLTLSRSINFLGRWLQPSDRNIKVSGSALIEIILPANEGAIANAEEIQ